MRMEKVSLNQQLEECVDVLREYYPNLKSFNRSMRPSVVDFKRSRMAAVRRTLEFVIKHEDGFRAYLEQLRAKPGITDGAQG
jgi:hypothetical protein